MFLVSSCRYLCAIYWSYVLSREWRCSWRSAERRCSNYIWVINNFIVCKGAPYIRGLTVVIICLTVDLIKLHTNTETNYVFQDVRVFCSVFNVLKDTVIIVTNSILTRYPSMSLIWICSNDKSRKIWRLSWNKNRSNITIWGDYKDQ